MKMVGRSALGMIGAAALLATGGGIALAESAATAQACSMRADMPNASNDSIQGRAGCGNTATVYGHVWEDRGAFPDDLVGDKTFQGGTSTVIGHCLNGPGNYYAAAHDSSGMSARSATAYRC